MIRCPSLVGCSAVGPGATISKIDPNGVVTTLFGGGQMNMDNPGESLFDAAGRLYISDTASDTVSLTRKRAAQHLRQRP